MKRALLVTATLAGALLAACGSTGASPPVTAATHASAAAFPVSVQSGDGTVRIPTRPTRILSLSASATQMLYAVGAGPQVVGVDKYSTYPPNAPRTKFTGYESSAEDYLPLRPDLVLLAFNTTNLVAQLEKLHIPTLLLPPATTVASAYQQIAEIAAATGHSGATRRTVAAIASDLSRVTRSVGNTVRGASYYIEYDPTLYSGTSKTFAGALFARLGMLDIANAASRAGSTYPQLSAEYLVKANPDYVFLADTVCCAQTAKTFAARPAFSTLRAVHLGHVFPVNDSLASEWGPHSLETFFALIAKDVTAPSRSAASSSASASTGKPG